MPFITSSPIPHHIHFAPATYFCCCCCSYVTPGMILVPLQGMFLPQICVLRLSLSCTFNCYFLCEVISTIQLKQPLRIIWSPSQQYFSPSNYPYFTYLHGSLSGICLPTLEFKFHDDRAFCQFSKLFQEEIAQRKNLTHCLKSALPKPDKNITKK